MGLKEIGRPPRKPQRGRSQTLGHPYLLRMWQESGGPNDPHGGRPRDPPLWRASLERPQGGQRLGFASLEDLFAFLENETRSSLPGSQDSEEEGK